MAASERVSWHRVLPLLRLRTVLLIHESSPEYRALVESADVVGGLRSYLYPAHFRNIPCDESAHHRSMPSRREEEWRAVVCAPTALLRPHLLTLERALAPLAFRDRLRALYMLSPRYMHEHLERHALRRVVLANGEEYEAADRVAVDATHPLLFYLEWFRVSTLSSLPCVPQELDTRLREAPHRCVYVSRTTFDVMRPLIHRDLVKYVLRDDPVALCARVSALLAYSWHAPWYVRPNAFSRARERCEVL